jgi:hypothetical protein
MQRIFSFIFIFLGSYLSKANTFYVTNTSVSGLGSFADAVAQANQLPDADTIYFNIVGIGPFVIPVNASIQVQYPLTIDGFSQPGNDSTHYDIRLEGPYGLILNSPDCIVRGIRFTVTSSDAIQLEGNSNCIISENNFVQCNTALRLNDHVSSVHDISIIRNLFYDNINSITSPYYPISASIWSINVDTNYFENSGSIAFNDIDSVPDLHNIRGNFFNNTDLGVGSFVKQVLVDGNTFTNSSSYYIRDFDSLIISHNVFDSTSQGLLWSGVLYSWRLYLVSNFFQDQSVIMEAGYTRDVYIDSNEFNNSNLWIRVIGGGANSVSLENCFVRRNLFTSTFSNQLEIMESSAGMYATLDSLLITGNIFHGAGISFD